MTLSRTLGSALTVALCLTTTGHAQSVGKMLPETDIEGLSQSGAKSVDEFAGRALLIEFFAYW